MSTEELFEKFEDCAGRSLAHDQVAPLFERLETLETVADLGQVTRLLEPRVLPSQAAERMASAAKAAPSPARKKRPGCLDGHLPLPTRRGGEGDASHSRENLA